MWQMVARKSKFIEQAFLGDKNVRTIEDVSETSQYEMAAALASGDERAIQLVGLRADIERLSLLKSAHASNQMSLAGDRRRIDYNLISYRGRLEEFKEVESDLPDYIGPVIDGKTGNESFEKRKDFGAALVKQLRQIFNGQKKIGKIGAINGVDVKIDVDGF